MFRHIGEIVATLREVARVQAHIIPGLGGVRNPDGPGKGIGRVVVVIFAAVAEAGAGGCGAEDCGGGGLLFGWWGGGGEVTASGVLGEALGWEGGGKGEGAEDAQAEEGGGLHSCGGGHNGMVVQCAVVVGFTRWIEVSPQL